MSAGTRALRVALIPLAIWSLAAERAAPLVRLSKEPRKLAARLSRLGLKTAHRGRLAARHHGRATRRTLKATVVYGYRAVVRLSRRAARILLVRPLRLGLRLAARLRAAAASGPPSEPPL